MASINYYLGELSGTVGNEVHYTRFGKKYVRSKATTFTDCQSDAQLRQRALFKAMLHTSALYGSILQRGLTKYAHDKGMTEANMFSNLNKDKFVYDNGKVIIKYRYLILAQGPITAVDFTGFKYNGLNVELTFNSQLDSSRSKLDDVVHIYAVEPDIEVCELVASVERVAGHAEFTLPDLSNDPNCKTAPTFYLYAIVERANTAYVPTLSAAEKKLHKRHRNINRMVSRSVFIGTVSI